VKVLIAKDDLVSSHLARVQLEKLGHEAIAVTDGLAGLALMEAPDSPRLVILDWTMPGLDGISLCRRIRGLAGKPYVYILILTGKNSTEDIVAAFEAGADDFLSKPVEPEELRARVQGGVRCLELQAAFTERARDLENVLAHKKLLQGLLPICSYCKRIRDDKNYWQNVESYLAEHSDLQFYSGSCPSCAQEHNEPQAAPTPKP
jgi:phosphoserine phosphatase RsbU/P